jgi:hypothetical protein
VQFNALDTSYDPAVASSRGIHLEARFIGFSRSKLRFSILNCCKQEGKDNPIAIYLRNLSLTMKQFESVKSEEFAPSDLVDL